jgi:para-nitrobenzyl esterase
MRFLCLSLFLPALLASAAIAPHAAPLRSAAQAPLAHVTTGTLQGISQQNIAVFKGIPFAAPPIGPLRWRAPQPPASWSGVRDAAQPSHPCTQNLHGTDNFIQPLAATYAVAYTPETLDPSEDCLYLNIWTPNLQPGAHLPVMVWLHGGSNRLGGGAQTAYDGTALASHGVLLVTINYRLGVMGFFSHPELTAESPHHSSGNYGLLDQIAALQWVQQNIAAFGGDPSNVTLFGESAGSVDATTLMTSPLAAGLFRRVIAESGPAFGLGPSRTVQQMQPLTIALGKQALSSHPNSHSNSPLEALRNLPAAQVAAMEDHLIATQYKGYDPNAAEIDGWVLPRSPAVAFATGKLLSVDLLAGFNAREFAAFRIVAEAAARKSPPTGPPPGMADKLKTFAALARPLYGNWTDLAVATYTARIIIQGTPAIDQASNDIGAACPVGAEAALTTSAGHHAYVYRFDRSVPGKGESQLGAFHSLEVPYVFGTFHDRMLNWLPFTAADHKLSDIMQTYWTNFAKFGDPNGLGLPHWSPWNTSQEPYMTFTQTGDAVPQQSLSPIFCHLSPDRLKQQLAN